jgi:hypothetical protein
MIWVGNPLSALSAGGKVTQIMEAWPRRHPSMINLS